jgi:predicted RNA methylase
MLDCRGKAITGTAALTRELECSVCEPREQATFLAFKHLQLRITLRQPLDLCCGIGSLPDELLDAQAIAPLQIA